MIIPALAEILDPMNDGSPPELFVNFGDDDRRVVIGDPPKITQMGNRSVGFLNLTQGASSEQPEYEANGINGLGSVESQDADRSLESLNTVGSAQVSFVAQFVWRQTLANTGYVFSIGLTPHAYVLAFDDTIDKFLSRSWNSVSGFIGAFYSTNTFGLNIPLVVTLIYDSPNIAVTLRVNGIQEGSVLSGLIDTTSTYNVHLLNHWGSAYLGLPGQQIGSFFFDWGSLPNLARIERRERYLANLYGISI